jgi:hypothetical protein
MALEHEDGWRHFLIATFDINFALRNEMIRHSCHNRHFLVYEGVSKSFRTESILKYTITFDITRWEATQRVMAAKLTGLIHKIAIQLHLVAESSGNFWIHPRIYEDLGYESVNSSLYSSLNIKSDKKWHRYFICGKRKTIHSSSDRVFL